MSLAIPLGRFNAGLAWRPVVTVPVVVYGPWWNVTGHRIRCALDRAGIAHRCVDVEADADAKRTLQSIVPDTLEFPIVYIEGEWLIAPTLETVHASLRRHGLIPSS